MRILVSLVSIAVAVYAGFSLLLYFLQERMVFLPDMPGRTLDATPQAIGLDYSDTWIDTADGERLHGWFIPAEHSRGTVLFFHGNAGNISHRLESIEIFNRLGMNVLIVDYRGYGQSSGKTGERGTYRDAQASWDHLVNERGLPAEHIVIFGRSLGGAVAAWLASQEEVDPAGLIVESVFTSGPDMARRLYAVLPVRLLTRIKYPAIEYVRRNNAPLLVIHSRDDEIIPFDMGQAVYEAGNQPKQFLELTGDHNAGFWLSRERYVPALDRFFKSALD